MASSNVLAISDELVVAAGDGDESALTQLWDACSPIIDDVLRYYRRGGNPDLDDVVQEAAVIFLNTVRTSPSRSSWLPTVSITDQFANALTRSLRWRLYNYLRRERRRRGRVVQADEQSLELALARAASGVAPKGVAGRQLSRAIERLSPRQRAVVTGLYDRELDVAELARELEVSPQAVTALHRRALAKLRGALAGQESRKGERTPARHDFSP